MEDTQKRQVAKKARISEILEGTYVRGEGWEPSYVLTKEGVRISRLNLIATIVSTTPGTPNPSIMVDDGTGTMGLRPFEDMPSLKMLEIGDIVNIIGKPKEYGAERYVVPEIVRAVKNEGWVKVRQKELELSAGQTQITMPLTSTPAQKAAIPIEEIGIEEVVPQQENSFQKIYRLIRKFDSGEGAPIEEVIKAAGLHNAEEIVGELLKEGEIFEIKSGRLKILE